MHFIITDRNVDALYGKKLQNFFRGNGFLIKKFVVPSGEKTKSLRFYKLLTEKILLSRFDKYSTIIGFGGGVINNLSGFLASTLYRGIQLIQIPTTLLAQLDAAIDFKQAINSDIGKNHLGSFYAASIIIIDPLFLTTLSERHIRSGMAESLKHAITQDKIFFRYLLSYNGKSKDRGFLEKVITHTIFLKTSLLNNKRNFEYAEMLPQYGHPIGHAIEYLSNYKLLHGEALAIGMCVTAEIAHLLEVCNNITVEQHYEIIRHFNLPVKLPKTISDRDIIQSIMRDKHFVKNVHSVLVASIGGIAKTKKSYSFEISTKILKRALVINRRKRFYL